MMLPELLVSLLVCLLISNANSSLASKNIPSEADFDAHARKFNLSDKFAAEKTKRLEIFRQNDAIIQQLAQENPLATFAHNQFSFYTQDEAFQILGVGKYSKRNFTSSHHHAGSQAKKRTTSATTPGQVIDWQAKGMISPIKDQAQCGSCWAFATVAMLESSHNMAFGKNMSYSEQVLVDCAAPGIDSCNGGAPQTALSYISNKGGIPLESTYPYAAVTQTCNATESAILSTNSTITKQTTGFGSTFLDTSLQNSPVIVAIAVANSPFMYYKSGILTSCASSDSVIDHSVLAVALLNLNGTYAYKIKNSWGTQWGMNGFAYLQAYPNATTYPNGMCLITTDLVAVNFAMGPASSTTATSSISVATTTIIPGTSSTNSAVFSATSAQSSQVTSTTSTNRGGVSSTTSSFNSATMTGSTTSSSSMSTSTSSSSSSNSSNGNSSNGSSNTTFFVGAGAGLAGCAGAAGVFFMRRRSQTARSAMSNPLPGNNQRWRLPQNDLLNTPLKVDLNQFPK